MVIMAVKAVVSILDDESDPYNWTNGTPTWLLGIQYVPSTTFSKMTFLNVSGTAPTLMLGSRCSENDAKNVRYRNNVEAWASLLKGICFECSNRKCII
jgi:hypothetical protein